MKFAELFQNKLRALEADNLYRSRTNFGKENWINFSSNDYLSVTTEKEIKKAYQEGFKKHPTGSGGSIFLSGYHPIHAELENTFAKALQVEACALFPSGFSANLSIPALLASIHAQLVIDKNVHASLYEGIKLANAQAVRYLSNNLFDLKRKLQKISGNIVIITEGIFSMNGSMAPLKEISQMGSNPLIVDEAHSFGVLGPQGLGAVPLAGLTQKEVPLRIIPLGKAFGASGAIVAGQKIWVEALLQCARSYIYSTAISPAYTYGLLKTLEYIISANERRQKLLQLITYFRTQINTSPFVWSDSASAIQQLQLGCPRLAIDFSEQLKRYNIFCLPVRTPSVTQKETGLRIILNYHHNYQDIDHLFASLHTIHEEQLQ